MIKDGALKYVDEVYGIHNWPGGIEGSISVSKKEMMAGVVIVNIKITGRGGHGSEPANSIDPITAGTFVHTALHTIKSWKILNNQVVAFTLCEFKSGSTMNVIPDSCKMNETIWYFDFELRDKVMAEIESIAKLTAQAHGCEALVSF